MLASRVYGYNPEPRFSVNHLTDYMAAQQASQRDKVIRDAKFPRKKPITAYQTPKREIQRFLGGGGRDLKVFDAVRADLAQTIRVDEERRDEARRDLKAIEAFIELWRKKRFPGIELDRVRTDLPLLIGKVLINVRMDVTLTATDDRDVRHSGGLVLFLAQTPQARKNVEERRRQVSQLVLWALEKGNMDPLPRLCMSLDVFGGVITKATEASSRFRGYVRSSCREVALKWPNVEPPEDYDGPDIP